MKNKNKGCRSLLCQKCKHYQKFLTVSTMQMICWNKGRFYEEGKIGILRERQKHLHKLPY